MSNTNKRHVGKIANTDQRCIVAWMQIPNREDHALCIPTDNLPPRLEHAVMQVLESQEGQSEEILANILNRRKMPDVPNRTLLEALHVGNHMVAVPVTQVIMFPRPNMPFPLADILRQQGKFQNQQVTAEERFAKDKFNSHAHNLASLSGEQRNAMARNLLIDAELLEKDVILKREKAYELAPDLRPQTIKMVEPSLGMETQTPLTNDFFAKLDESLLVDKATEINYFDITKLDDE
jgi:hypothetical protein